MAIILLIVSYNLKKLLSIVLKAKKTNKKSFLFYDKDENMCCYVDWCYRVKERRVKLSDLIPEYKPNISTEYYQFIKKDIIENGLDNKKGVITIKKNNSIIDGHHRYFILKEIFGCDYEITAIEFLDNHNVILHYVFLFLIIKPIKIIYNINLMFYRGIFYF